MKITRYILAIIILLATVAGATALEITPSVALSNVYVNEPHTASITLSNNDTYDYYNVTFSNLDFFSFPVISKLAIGQSLVYNFTITTTSSFSRTPLTSVVSYKYYIDVPVNPILYNVSISDTAFSPKDIVIYTGDSIIWNNTGTVTHSITCSKWDYPLPVNTTKSLTFNDIEKISYYDTTIFFTGSIDIKNRSVQELAHNSAYDKDFTVNVESVYHETNLSLSILDTSFFNISWNSQTEGLLKVINDGQESAHHINLSYDSNYFAIIFDENNFDLNPSQSNIVTFEIRPTINSTTQTNMNYTVPISVHSENGGGIGTNITVFVPYHVLNENETVSEWWEDKLEFCRTFPTSPYCITAPVVQYVNVSTNATPTLSVNFTEAQLMEMLMTLRKNADTSARIENQWKLDVENMQQRIAQIENSTASTKDIALSNEEKRDTTTMILWFGGTTFVILVCIGILALLSYQTKKRRIADAVAGLKPLKKKEGDSI